MNEYLADMYIKLKHKIETFDRPRDTYEKVKTLLDRLNDKVKKGDLAPSQRVQEFLNQQESKVSKLKTEHEFKKGHDPELEKAAVTIIEEILGPEAIKKIEQLKLERLLLKKIQESEKEKIL